MLGKRCDLYLPIKIILPPHPPLAGPLPKTQHQNARPKTNASIQHKKSSINRLNYRIVENLLAIQTHNKTARTISTIRRHMSRNLFITPPQILIKPAETLKTFWLLLHTIKQPEIIQRSQWSKINQQSKTKVADLPQVRRRCLRAFP